MTVEAPEAHLYEFRLAAKHRSLKGLVWAKEALR